MRIGPPLLALLLIGTLGCAACTPWTDNGEDLHPLSNKVATDTVRYAAGRLQHLIRTGEMAATPTEITSVDAYMYSDERHPKVTQVYWEVVQRSTGTGFTVRYQIVTYYSGEWDYTLDRSAYGRACGIVTVILADEPTRSTATGEVIECPGGTPARPTRDLSGWTPRPEFLPTRRSMATTSHSTTGPSSGTSPVTTGR